MQAYACLYTLAEAGRGCQVSVFCHFLLSTLRQALSEPMFAYLGWKPASPSNPVLPESELGLHVLSQAYPACDEGAGI